MTEPVKRRGRRIGLFLLLCLLAPGAVAAYLLHDRYTGFADTPLAGVQAGETFVVERGDSFQRVLGRLREAGIVEGHELEWRALARQLGADARIQVGEYPLDPSVTPRELLVRMRDGRVIRHRFTIVEGWNIRELRAALAKAPLLQETAGLDDAALMKALGHEGQHPEGRFLPETYAWVRGDSDLDILRRAHADMARALDEAWASRAQGLPLANKDEALVLASIVEKETGIAEERPQIAGVFVRRLRIGMRLQTDPTVIYGMGAAYQGNIRRSDLTADTPYNTYTRVGLPPTPIAMPGRAALQAAVNPAPGDALFFVSRNDGSHVFSATYAEHNRAVDCYQRRRGCPPGQQALPAQAAASPAGQDPGQDPAQGPAQDPGPR